MRKDEILYVLEELKIRNYKVSGGSVMISCVAKDHPGSDENPSCGIKISSNEVALTHCFTCGWKGIFYDYVKEYYFNNKSKFNREKIEYLLNYILECDAHCEPEEKVEEAKVPEELLLRLNKFKKLKKFGRIFGEKSFWEKWGIGSNRKRILFPILNKEGEVKLIQGRWIDETWKSNGVQKYKFFPIGGKKSLYLYGEHLIENTVNKLIITEGIIDCINVNYFLEQLSINDILAISLMGSKTSETQLNKIKKFGKNEVILMLDNDTAGYNETDKLIYKLKNTHKVSLINYSEKDPDLFLHRKGGNEFERVLLNRKSVFEIELEKRLRPSNFKEKILLDKSRFVRYNKDSYRKRL